MYELWSKRTPENKRALKAREAMLEAKTEKSSNDSLFPDEKLKANDSNNPALNKKGSRTRQSCTDS